MVKYYVDLRFLTGLAVLLLASSCKKFIEVAPPRNEIVTTEVFSDSTNATAAVLGIYVDAMLSPFVLGFANGGNTIYSGLSSDELYSSSGDPEKSEFQNNVISPRNSSNFFLWTNAYRIIYRTNVCLENLTNSDKIKDATKNQLMGECKFIRAFIYFNLLNLYGNVPFINTTGYKVNSKIERTNTDSIYEKITSDLTDAIALLSGDISTSKNRPDKYAATALLSRVYLYREQWDESAEAVTEVINSGNYGLEVDLNSVFLVNSSESIWQLPPLANEYATSEGYQFIPYISTIIPPYVITDHLLAAFETGDKRKEAWLNFNDVGGTIYTYPYKYKLGYIGSSTSNEQLVFFRLAEQYLIRAEARAHLNDFAGSLDDINLIRNRAGLPAIIANDQASLLLAVQHERQVELFCECGHRWYDLKRNGTINSILSAEKPGWQDSHALYPIPFDEILANPFLMQNPGY